MFSPSDSRKGHAILSSEEVMDTGATRRDAPSPLLVQCLNVLREQAPKLREQGIVHAGIFGSVARGDDDPKSDVDVLIDISAFDVAFGITKMVRLRRELSN